MMPPRLRFFALTVHVATSVGWLGAVVSFLALAVAAVTSHDVQIVHAMYLAMHAIGWYVLVPLSMAALLTGLVQSLGTRWGLFRHYWVIAKLLVNVIATTILLLYMPTLDTLTRTAMQQTLSAVDLRVLRTPSPILHAAAALAVLLLATVLSVYKPRGITPYGWRRQQERHHQQRFEMVGPDADV